MIDSPKLNPEILKQCRRQIGLDNIEDAKKVTGIDSLADIEQANKPPTLLQQEKIANAYSVPSWVFFQRSLPPEYDFSREEYHPEFQALQDSQEKLDYRRKKMIVSFHNFRSDLLSIYEDDGVNIAEFSPPQNDDLQVLATETREWLGYDEEEFRKHQEEKRALDYWKRLMEDRDILVFTTLRDPCHWSYLDGDDRRGLAFHHKTFPIIVINGSHSPKSQPFTLMCELAHIIKGRTSLDLDYLASEKFCNEFAGEIIMPDEQVIPTIKKLKAKGLDLDNITTNIGNMYGVSKSAVATKMVFSGQMSQTECSKYKNKLNKLYLENGQKNDGKESPKKNSREIINLHGRTYTAAILQLYNDEEITLSKLCNALGITKIKIFDELQEEMKNM